ncbi:hypothetical protein DFH09DRAFT_1281893 [Mycena vulgaris]|nr:hypothetical protein DFH09DRAFT_1281893 [Mycena vulgaris]
MCKTRHASLSKTAEDDAARKQQLATTWFKTSVGDRQDSLSPFWFKIPKTSRIKRLLGRNGNSPRIELDDAAALKQKRTTDVFQDLSGILSRKTRLKSLVQDLRKSQDSDASSPRHSSSRLASKSSSSISLRPQDSFKSKIRKTRIKPSSTPQWETAKNQELKTSRHQDAQDPQDLKPSRCAQDLGGRLSRIKTQDLETAPRSRYSRRLKVARIKTWIKPLSSRRGIHLSAAQNLGGILRQDTAPKMLGDDESLASRMYSAATPCLVFRCVSMVGGLMYAAILRGHGDCGSVEAERMYALSFCRGHGDVDTGSPWRRAKLFPGGR